MNFLFIYFFNVDHVGHYQFYYINIKNLVNTYKLIVINFFLMCCTNINHVYYHINLYTIFVMFIITLVFIIYNIYETKIFRQLDGFILYCHIYIFFKPNNFIRFILFYMIYIFTY